MKKYFVIALSLLASNVLQAQGSKKVYPDPEFSNEVSFLKKDSIMEAVRLEKGSSKMESKTKMGGMGGYESGYSLEGSKSAVRLQGGNGLNFIYSTGAAEQSSNPAQDSMMRANGMDPAMMRGGGMGGFMDPTSMITLYKAESSKGERKIVMQKSGGAIPFASKKIKSSDKYTFSVKKIREGYWVLVVDKSLSSGEYAFAMNDMTSMTGGTILFAFGID